MSEFYSDLDRLVIERWDDIRGLIKAQKDVQSRMDEVIEQVGQRLRRWTAPLGFEVEAAPSDGEFHAWRPEWADKRKGARVYFVVGGFWPDGYHKLDAKAPYIGLYTGNLEQFRMKEAERTAFGRALRTALDGQGSTWEEDSYDADLPLNRYLKHYDGARRSALIGDADRLFEFSKEQLTSVFQLADIVGTQLASLTR
jgi:hypothetical protein